MIFGSLPKTTEVFLETWLENERRRNNRARIKREYAERNRDLVIARATKWNSVNRLRRLDRLREWNRDQQVANPQRVLAKNLRTRLWFALKAQNSCSKRLEEKLGCSVSEFKRHIARQFKPGWSWENWGTRWEIDHIRPCQSFDLRSAEQVRECFHFSNQRPLSIYENRSKGAKF